MNTDQKSREMQKTRSRTPRHRGYLSCFLSVFICVHLWPLSSSAGADDTAALARKAQDIFKTNCYRCNGQDGTVEGGLNYVLDFKTLVARKKVIPGDAGKSRLFKRLTSDDNPMPPEEEKVRPSKDDVAAIKQWIEAGAPDVQTAPRR